VSTGSTPSFCRFGRTRAWLIAHDDDTVPEDIGTSLRADIAERARGVPLGYLLGEREFHGLMLRVTPDVLVPRPDTELLVDWALELLTDALAAIGSPTVADLGTGSGAIALAVKRACPRAQVLAVDASEAALAVARDNAARLALDLESIRSDWLADLGNRRFHMLLSNPPYIDGDDPHLAALHAEPMLALTPGCDGMAALRTIVDQAPAHLHPGGWLLLEHGHTQAAAVTRALCAGGFEQVRTRCDLAGLPRCSGGRWSTNATFTTG
jgi:release factor glutamine methyltransferase